jgi:hypothetical protein
MRQSPLVLWAAEDGDVGRADLPRSARANMADERAFYVTV